MLIIRKQPKEKQGRTSVKNRAYNSGLIETEARIVSSASVVGRAEFSGPLSDFFDLHDDTDRFGQPTWEQAESEMQRRALSIAIKKSGASRDDIGAIFAGDLLNQCVGAAYGLSEFGAPYFGLYGACSTSAESLILSSLTVSAGFFDLAAAVTSSHNCSAERQFRTPIEYGGQRPPSAQWTVTGAGAFLVAADRRDSPFITHTSPTVCQVLPGIVTDKGINDPNNMGAAMAPAAVSTLTRYFRLSGKHPDEFDLILTGDLGRIGSEILVDMLKAEGIDISGVHNDCGLIIYEGIDSPDVNSGGSGCGCAASVLAAYVLPKLASGELKNILFIATGAMMSTSSLQQGLTIPGIAHLLRIRN